MKICPACGVELYDPALCTTCAAPPLLLDGVLPAGYWEQGGTWFPPTTRCRIHKLHGDLPLPAQANFGDAGWDLVAADTVTFDPLQIKLVPLGIIAEAPLGYHFKLFLRSSMAKKGWSLANSVGIIDSSYAGPEDEIKALIRAPKPTWNNLATEYFTIERGQRICQLILEKNNDIVWDVQENRDFAGKSRGGFGSSGA